MKPQWLIVFQIVVSLFLVGKSISEMSLPPDCDEQGIIDAVNNGTSRHYLNFTNPGTQTLPAVLSIVSMKVFGTTVVASRIPSIGLTIILLLALGLFSFHYLSHLTTVLLYLHLLVNESANWFFHSARAYCLMMLLSVASLFLFWTGLVQTRKDFKKEMVLFLALFFIAFLNHLFSIVAFALFIFTAVVWMYLNREKLSENQKNLIQQYSKLLLFVAPLILVIAGISMWYMSKIPRAFSNPVSDLEHGTLHINPRVIFACFLGALGIFKSKWLYVLAGITAVLLWKQRTEISESPRLNYLWIYLASATVAFVGITMFAKSGELTGRYLLAYPIIFIIAVGESIIGIKEKYFRYGITAAFFLILVLVPLLESSPQLVTNICEKGYIFSPYFKRWF